VPCGNLVTGDDSIAHCSTARAMEDYCGRYARWFEPKEAK
jgi:hypothetical protein